MERSESVHIFAAIIVLFAITAFRFILDSNWTAVYISIFFSIILICGTVLTKKWMAHNLDADVEHEIWSAQRYWFKPQHHLDFDVPIGIIFPLLFSVYSLGTLKIPTLLTYEAAPMKRRAARRFGFSSYAELTDWHIGLIGAAGMIFTILFAVILYLLPFNLEYFAMLATVYAFFNMLPIGKLDGAQIFFGSRTLYTTIAIIVIIFTIYAAGMIFALA